METSLRSAFTIRTVDFAQITVEAAKKSLLFEKAPTGFLYEQASHSKLYNFLMNI